MEKLIWSKHQAYSVFPKQFWEILAAILKNWLGDWYNGIYGKGKQKLLNRIYNPTLANHRADLIFRKECFWSMWRVLTTSLVDVILNAVESSFIVQHDYSNWVK